MFLVGFFSSFFGWEACWIQPTAPALEGEVLTTEPPGMPPGQVVLTLPRRHRAAQHSLEPSCPDLILCPLVDPQPDLRALQIWEPFQGIGKKDWGAEGTCPPSRASPQTILYISLHPYCCLKPSGIKKKGKKRKLRVLRLRHLEGKEGMKEATVRGRVHLEKGFFKFLKLWLIVGSRFCKAIQSP